MGLFIWWSVWGYVVTHPDLITEFGSLDVRKHPINCIGENPAR